METLLTIKEVARYLRLDPQTVSRKAQRGDLPGFKVGNRWRFRKEDIDRSILSGPERRDPFEGPKKYLQTRQEVSLVYLFGSRARGEALEGSDIDIGILFREGVSDKDQDQILLEMGSTLERAADLVPLNQATSLLKYEVVSEGKILVQNITDEERIGFELGVYREYFHTERIRWLQFESLTGSERRTHGL